MTRRRPFLYLALALLASCGTASVPYSSTSASQAALHASAASLETSNEVDGIRNFHEVHPTLFRSGELAATNAAELQAHGIRTVLSLQNYSRKDAATEQHWLAAAGIQFIWLPMSPFEKPTVAAINQALADIDVVADQPIDVHCALGSDRTGIVVAAYRIKYDGWTYDQAVAEMRTYGHSVFLRWWDSVLKNIH